MQKLRYHIIYLLLLFLVGCAAKNKLNQDENLDKLFSKGTQIEGPFSIEQIEKDNMIKVEKDGKSSKRGSFMSMASSLNAQTQTRL